jgi:hypothetical protein
VLGVVMIMIGIYALLWGKLKDIKASMDENYFEGFPKCEEILSQNENKVDDIEAMSNNPMNVKI